MRYKILVVFCVSLALVSHAFAQAEKIGNISAQAALVTEFDINGLKVIVKRRASAPTVSAGLFIRGGSRNINEKNAGIERLMLATAIEAGKKIPRETVRRQLSRTGSSIGSGAAQDFSVVSLATTRENFDQIWNIFTEVTLDPAFTDSDIKRNKDIILTGLRESEITPDGALRALHDRVVFAGHPYANEVSGTPATINAITAENLKAYHRDTMQTSKLLLVFVGDLDPNKLKSKIAASFGKLPRGEYKEPVYPALDFSKGTVDVTPRNLPTNYIQGTYEAPSLKHPDYYPMLVATSILQSLVYNEVRVRRQLSYAPNAEMNNFATNTGNISVTATEANTAVEVMLDQIRMLRTGLLNDEVISEVSGYFLTKHYLGQETNAAQVAELARYELVGGGWRNAFEVLDRIREVKPADVRNVANKYMKNIRFAVVGNELAVNKSVFLASE